MTRIAVTDPSDRRLDPYRELHDRSRRRAAAHFIVESEIAVTRLLQSRFPTESVLATRGHIENIVQIAPAHVPVYEVEHAVLNEVVGFDLHRGCVACGVRPTDNDDRSAEVLDALRSREKSTIVVAQGLADPANVGAVVRCCRAFTVDLLVLDGRAADPFERRAIRASMGHVFTQPLVTSGDLAGWVERARSTLGADARVLAAVTERHGTRVNDVECPDHLVLLLGNEGRGLAPDLLARADTRVTIPIDPAADSLNVAAATAVLLHVLRPFSAAIRPGISPT
jgi:tRNA G18 (ribose-2'-O)-methylase SpoU